MYFDLTDEQKLLRDSVETVLQRELAGTRLMALYNENGSADPQLWKALCGLGIAGILLPEAHGGVGMDLLALAVVAQACGYHGAPVPIVPSALAAWLLCEAGSNSQKTRWLPRLISGEAIAAFALNEEGGRWLPAQWQLTCASATLSGGKRNVERANEATLLVVGLANGALALVEPHPSLQFESVDSLDRTRPLQHVLFNSTPCELLTTDQRIADRLSDAMLVLIAADACGAGCRARDMAVAYAKVRKQFGRTIGTFQSLKHQLADMTVEIEPCFALVWYAAYAWDAIPEECAGAAARAKAHVGDAAVKVARRAVEAHGGIGYTWEYALHVWLKRAMADRNSMGLPAMHRERVAALAGW